MRFEAKEEMKWYYDIIHKPFKQHFWESCFQGGVTRVSDNIVYKMY